MPLRVGSPLPSLEGATRWLNGEVCSEHLLGRPIFVQFWAVSCPICKVNMPALKRWRDAIGEEALQYVSVHTPRAPSDMDEDEIERLAESLGISEPCALDTHREIADRFETGGLWPYYFLFDADGRMVRRAAGTIGLRLIEAALQQMAARHPESTTPS